MKKFPHSLLSSDPERLVFMPKLFKFHSLNTIQVFKGNVKRVAPQSRPSNLSSALSPSLVVDLAMPIIDMRDRQFC